MGPLYDTTWFVTRHVPKRIVTVIVLSAWFFYLRANGREAGVLAWAGFICGVILAVSLALEIVLYGALVLR